MREAPRPMTPREHALDTAGFLGEPGSYWDDPEIAAILRAAIRELERLALARKGRRHAKHSRCKGAKHA